MGKLVPTTHMLKSVRSKNWHLAGAIKELVDNSLGHGKATEVTVIIDNNAGIGVIDNGIGIDDINRVFRFGDASSHDDLGEIGEYGVGAKNSTIYLGDHVTVWTVRDRRKHLMTVNWAKVEASGEWPDEYEGKGTKPLPREEGTTVVVQALTRTHQLVTSEKLGKELGQSFSPAIRDGVKIRVYHRLKNGKKQDISVEPYTPADMTKEIAISGEVKTKHGALRWTGRAGLSASLTERYNGVHIGFGHRIIETTREPFYGESAPTLYVEVTLDKTTPWKYALAEHKDKVVRHRDELMTSIHEQIKELLRESAEQASYLKLEGMTAPIEAQLTRALKGAGILHVDPDEEPEEGGEFGRTDKPVKPTKRAHEPKDEGDAAKELNRPTGVQIVWRTREQLEDKLWSWEISGKRMAILLDKDQFRATIGYPPKVRDDSVIQIVASFLSHAIEIEYQLNSPGLRNALTPTLLKEIATMEPYRVAPYLNRRILEKASK